MWSVMVIHLIVSVFISALLSNSLFPTSYTCKMSPVHSSVSTVCLCCSPFSFHMEEEITKMLSYERSIRNIASCNLEISMHYHVFPICYNFPKVEKAYIDEWMWSQNHRLVWVRRDLKDPLIPAPLLCGGTPFTRQDFLKPHPN